jgi:eukaryotic-like serine/threonine-protein kinase
MDAATLPGEAPELLPPHEILEEIGRGDFGIVHRARDTVHDRIVALKQLAPDLLRSEDVGPFLREVRAAAQVRHPHLLPILAAGLHEGRPCFTMKLAAKKGLAERRNLFSDPRAAADLVEKLARAAAAAHAHGLLHGRLTPHKIHFDENGEPLVGGFGFFPWWSSIQSEAQIMSVGNIAYCAPEQLASRPDSIEAPTDVWALGVILHELLTGRRPFNDAGGLETARSIQSDDPVRPRRLRPDLDHSLEAVVLRCLEKQSANRYPSARALADDLERWLRAEPTAARPETLTQRILRGLSRSLRGKAP